MIKEGGDTDTNSCIVGGMIGALVGLNAIPEDMYQKVVNFDCSIEEQDSKVFKKRPEFLSTKKHLLPNIEKLVKIRPSKDICV